MSNVCLEHRKESRCLGATYKICCTGARNQLSRAYDELYFEQITAENAKAYLVVEPIPQSAVSSSADILAPIDVRDRSGCNLDAKVDLVQGHNICVNSSIPSTQPAELSESGMSRSSVLQDTQEGLIRMAGKWRALELPQTRFQICLSCRVLDRLYSVAVVGIVVENTAPRMTDQACLPNELASRVDVGALSTELTPNP